jgi:hypothetical protein
MVGLVAMVRPGQQPAASLPQSVPRAVAAATPAAVAAEPMRTATVSAPAPIPVIRIVNRAVLSPISFQTPTIRASAMQSLVAIPVQRTTSSGSAAFVWRVEGGSAQAGIDYQHLEPQVVRFHDGQSIRTLFVPLVQHDGSSAQRDPRTFTVTLQRVTGGPTLGDIPRVTVAIDPMPPPLSRRPLIYLAAAPAVTTRVADCRQRAPLRLACLFSWRPRSGGPSIVND